MGGSYSVPLSLEEKSKPFRLHQHITAAEYMDQVEETSAISKVTAVPVELTSQVSLYQEVDLSYGSILELPPALPLTLPHLTHLILAHNQIATIPESIFGFLHLEVLDLSHNRLQSLPDSLVLLERLRRLDLSHNYLRSLPTNLDSLRQLSKLNLSFNHLAQLPITLGNITNLRVILANNNEFPPEMLVLCEEGSCARLLAHLRTCYSSSLGPEDTRPVNLFPRARGSLFQTRVLNAGSAQAFFNQIQGQAVQTGNRLLTPLIPPPSSSSLDLERFKDAILGMFYGAAIGDSLGILTEFMRPSEADFYYDKESFDSCRMHVDQHRCHYQDGEVSVSSHLLLLVLESVLKWAGVVDELDYAKRLSSLVAAYPRPLYSHVLEGVTRQAEQFRADPGAEARAWAREHEGAEELYLVCDNHCLPPVIGLVISQFHDLKEVRSNASRICGSTHAHTHNIQAAGWLAEVLARQLQGSSLTEALASTPGEEWSRYREDISHPWSCLEQVEQAAASFQQQQGFRGTLLDTIMTGGHASVNGCVVGAVLGLATGYTDLPAHWIHRLDPVFRKSLDKKLNTLFDSMGIP